MTSPELVGSVTECSVIESQLEFRDKRSLQKLTLLIMRRTPKGDSFRKFAFVTFSSRRADMLSCVPINVPQSRRVLKRRLTKCDFVKFRSIKTIFWAVAQWLFANIFHFIFPIRTRGKGEVDGKKEFLFEQLKAIPAHWSCANRKNSFNGVCQVHWCKVNQTGWGCRNVFRFSQPAAQHLARAVIEALLVEKRG